MPSLGHSILNDRGWRNPVRGYDYVRTEWQAYQTSSEASRTLARVQLAEDGTFEVSSGEAPAKVTDPQAAFELAAGWAMAKISA